MELKVIITGVTGMVGEGVLLECLENPAVQQVLTVSRKSSGWQHPKLKECIVPDFLQLDVDAIPAAANPDSPAAANPADLAPSSLRAQLSGYDACFFCAGISSIGLNEADFTRITYDTTLHFAQQLVRVNRDMVFDYVSGSHTDSTEKGKVMWARVKGRTENALTKLSFKGVYNFRPGLMRPMPGQKNIKPLLKVLGTILYPVFRLLMPGQVMTLSEVGQAMINSVTKGYPKQILEIKDIKALAKL
jgi:uncharacterized protein YbjT (DUF2867 family)